MTDQFPHPRIKHIIYLMLENRGFDHFMGWLYPPAGPNEPAPAINLVSYPNDPRPYMGLSQAMLDTLKNAFPDSLRPKPEPAPVIMGARSPKTPSYNPGEDFPHIMNQMWGTGHPVNIWTDPALRGPEVQRLMAAGGPRMNGYMLDFAFEMHHAGVADPQADQLTEIIETYLPEQLPVLCGLAKSFAVSDEWYCSVPSQTNTNRAFSLTGTSRGMVNNGFYTPDSWNPEVRLIETKKSLHSDALPASTGSLFEIIQAANYSWKVFWQAEWPPRYLTTGVSWQYTRTLIPALLSSQFDANFVKFDAKTPNNPLFEAIRSGQLPALSYIEPKWSGGASWGAKMRLIGNEYHPVSDTTVPEDFLRDLYGVLAGSPHADDTLLVITFDENGGTYDHVVPPEAPAPKNEAVPLPHGNPDRHDLHEARTIAAGAITSDPMTRTQYGFNFKQYGVRVPTLLISSHIPQNTVFRSETPGKVFDHTSIIASILEIAQIDKTRWMLGERVDQAPTFTHLFAAPVAQLNKPAKPFSFTQFRSQGANVQAGFAYKLAYAGSLWPRAGNPRYLGPPAWGVREYYPTLVDNAHAAPYYLLPQTGNGAGTISNMSKINICLDSLQLGAESALRVKWTNKNTFFGGRGNGDSDGGSWEIRLLQSRDPGDTIRVGDYVAFFSCLPAHAGASFTDVTTPDPLQRLLPDPDNASYLTTAAGEWALWQIMPL